MGRLWQVMWRDHYSIWFIEGPTGSRSFTEPDMVSWSWVEQRSASIREIK